MIINNIVPVEMFYLRYNHIKSFGTGMKQFPKASAGFALGGGAAPAAAAADDDDDVDLFGSRYFATFFLLLLLHPFPVHPSETPTLYFV